MKLYEYHEWLALYKSMPTERQTQVLQCIANGMTYREAANKLGLSHQTVKNHVSHALKRMGMVSTPAAIAEGFRRGILE